MTQDEIIRMALEAGYQSVYLADAPVGRSYKFLERFAALVAAHEREKFLNKLDSVSEKVIYETVKEAVLAEREACAKVCDDMARTYWMSEAEEPMEFPDAHDCAAAIRKRSKK